MRIQFAFRSLWCVLALASSVHASHGSFPVSSGVYRIPMIDGTTVTVGNDHHDHEPVNRIDMSAGSGTPVVAAASGWIRAIVEFHGNSPNPGDGLAADGVTPQDDSLEHSCQDGKPAVANSVVAGLCQQHNNYVWIEHPNGEWTKYTHFGTGTVTELGWAVGDWVNVGETLGEEGDVGRASGPHLHWEVGLPDDPTDPTPFDTLGGFLNGSNVVGQICDIPDNLFVSGEDYTANPCVHEPPIADAGGPYVVDEGSNLVLDGSGSSDPEGLPLTYLWSPPNGLDDPSIAQPTFSTVDDAVVALTLSVWDTTEALGDSDDTTVTVLNVPPTVSAEAGAIDEAGTTTLTATVFDPGTLDTHTAVVDWGDGTFEDVSVDELASGISHVYGDDGSYAVAVTVTDDDGGVGVDDVFVEVSNLAPALQLDTSGAVSFPGGDYLVTDPGVAIPLFAQGNDDGSDDLTFSWSTGDVSTYFNDGVGPDPFPSPFGTFPFAAADVIDAVYDNVGVETLSLVLTDDDGGADGAAAGVIVVGTADRAESSGWWKHQYSGRGKPGIDLALSDAYLDIVDAVSSVFSEDTALGGASDAHAVLSPFGGDKRATAKADLLVAWLAFASGAVSWDATITVGGADQMAFLDLMFAAEATILDTNATQAELLEVSQLLAKVR